MWKYSIYEYGILRVQQLRCSVVYTIYNFVILSRSLSETCVKTLTFDFMFIPPSLCPDTILRRFTFINAPGGDL